MPEVVAELLDQHLDRYDLAGDDDALVFTANGPAGSLPPTGISVPGGLRSSQRRMPGAQVPRPPSLRRPPL
jgi:hypothetical protein